MPRYSWYKKLNSASNENDLESLYDFLDKDFPYFGDINEAIEHFLRKIDRLKINERESLEIILAEIKFPEE